MTAAKNVNLGLRFEFQSSRVIENRNKVFRFSVIFMWTFTRSVKIHILRSCSFPDWDGTFRDNSSQPFRKLSRVFGESEVLEPRVNVKLARRHKESITQAKYLNFINRNLKFVKCSTSTSSVKDASGIRAHQKKNVVAASYLHGVRLNCGQRSRYFSQFSRCQLCSTGRQLLCSLDSHIIENR